MIANFCLQYKEIYRAVLSGSTQEATQMLLSCQSESYGISLQVTLVLFGLTQKRLSPLDSGYIILMLSAG